MNKIPSSCVPRNVLILALRARTKSHFCFSFMTSSQTISCCVAPVHVPWRFCDHATSATAFTTGAKCDASTVCLRNHQSRVPFFFLACLVLLKNKKSKLVYKSTRPLFCVYGLSIVLQTLWRCTLTKGSCERRSKDYAGHLIYPRTFLGLTKENCSEMSGTSWVRSNDKVALSALPWAARFRLVHFYSMPIFYASWILARNKRKNVTRRVQSTYKADMLPKHLEINHALPQRASLNWLFLSFLSLAESSILTQYYTVNIHVQVQNSQHCK